MSLGGLKADGFGFVFRSTLPVTCPFGFRATRGIWAVGYGCTLYGGMPFQGKGQVNILKCLYLKRGKKELWFMEMVLCRSKWIEFSPF